MAEDQISESVTADDVAERAGVSRWTVSRAFRRDASISAKSRERVLAAAQDLGYAPDLSAASLASDRSRLVSLLIDDFANPHKLVLMECLTETLRRNGWDTLLVNTLGGTDASAALLTASQRRVDAAVLIGVRFDERALASALGARRIRKLIMFARMSHDPDTLSICCDDRAAMREVTMHVIGRNYRRPLFVAGPRTRSAHVERQETFLSGWRAARGFTPEAISAGAYDQRLAFDAVADYLARRGPGERPDILVCENDAVAMGAIDAIRHKIGLRVPQDIAVTGFDDTPQSQNPNYRLTTYRQPLAEMAQALTDVLNGEPPDRDLKKFTGQLIVRESA